MDSFWCGQAWTWRPSWTETGLLWCTRSAWLITMWLCCCWTEEPTPTPAKVRLMSTTVCRNLKMSAATLLETEIKVDTHHMWGDTIIGSSWLLNTQDISNRNMVSVDPLCWISFCCSPYHVVLSLHESICKILNPEPPVKPCQQINCSVAVTKTKTAIEDDLPCTHPSLSHT